MLPEDGGESSAYRDAARGTQRMDEWSGMETEVNEATRQDRRGCRERSKGDENRDRPRSVRKDIPEASIPEKNS